MSTRISQDLAYAAPAERVRAMLVTPAFREEVCARLKVLRASATAVPTAGGTLVTIDQVQPTRGLPSFARKLVGDEIQIVQQETWTGPTHADVHVTIPGNPGEMDGRITLRESAGTTVQTVELDIRVRIPLVGGRIEALVGDMLLKALRKEHETGRDYLSR
jgi:hypothetical protein